MGLLSVATVLAAGAVLGTSCGRRMELLIPTGRGVDFPSITPDSVDCCDVALSNVDTVVACVDTVVACVDTVVACVGCSAETPEVDTSE